MLNTRRRTSLHANAAGRSTRALKFSLIWTLWNSLLLSTASEQPDVQGPSTVFGGSREMAGTGHARPCPAPPSPHSPTQEDVQPHPERPIFFLKHYFTFFVYSIGDPLCDEFCCSAHVRGSVDRYRAVAFDLSNFMAKDVSRGSDLPLTNRGVVPGLHSRFDDGSSYTL